jgi:hypothetical protein
MRHRRNISPTGSLVIQGLSAASAPLPYLGLAEATGASIYTLKKVTRTLVKQGIVSRQTHSGMSYFSLATLVGGAL